MDAGESQSQGYRQEESESQRYRHLLDPIRDVCANWNLNIKEYLDDYLEKLKRDKERTIVREDGEVIRFNFAEAAQIIQSSLKIYCQKVDFLYEAVSEAFMGISNTKKKKNSKDQDQSNSESNSGRINAEFDLLDEKDEMLEHRIDTKWLLEQSQKKAKLGPLKVGNRREEGRRDRFVDLPITFIPTKKSAPSEHCFRYKQNNETIYIPQSDLFSFNSIAIASPGAEQMTTFMNAASLRLVHDFSAELVPYLRDENNQRLQQIGPPYNIDAPVEIYNRLLELDERENRRNESHAFFDEDCEQFEVISIAGDESNVLQTPRGFRSSIVEAPRLSYAPSANMLTGPRESDLRNFDAFESQPLPLFAEEENPPNRFRTFSVASVELTSSTAPRLNVDEELTYQDHYVDVKARLRKKPDDKKAKKLICVPAEELCKIRNDKAREKYTERGKDYDAHKRNIFEYTNARIFTSLLCKTGSILDNITPRMRARTVQALNRVFYAQEKYEKSIKAQRRRNATEREKARKREEQRNERNLRKLKRLEALQPKRALEPAETTEPRPQPILTPRPVNEISDHFGVEPELELDGAAKDRAVVDDYNPAVQLTQAIGDFGDGLLHDDLDHEPANLFEGDTLNSTLAFPEDAITGDSTLMTGTTFEFGTFATNDPAFFEMEKLGVFFSQTQMDIITDDEILLHAIHSFWSESNQQSQANLRHRLQNWSAHILERLDDDSRHKPFEIHGYGTTILDRFGSEIGKILKFREIVKGVPKYEISRYLLALLILANCGNVEIINDGGSAANRGQPVINKRTKIKLLSTERHHEIFQSEQLLVTG